MLLTLAEIRGAFTVRQLARVAHVSTSTALRVTNELRQHKQVVRLRIAGRAGWWLHAEPLAFRGLRQARPRRSRAEQLDYLRELDAPVWVVEPKHLASWGVSRKFKSLVILPRTWRGVIDAPKPYVVLDKSRSLELGHKAYPPEIELLVALLKLDPRSAGQMYSAMELDWKVRRKLLRRIRDERLTVAAKKARIPLDARRRP